MTMTDFTRCVVYVKLTRQVETCFVWAPHNYHIVIPRKVTHSRWRSRNLSRYVVLVGEVFKVTPYFGRTNLLACDLRLNVCAASSMAADVGDTGCCG